MLYNNAARNSQLYDLGRQSRFFEDIEPHRNEFIRANIFNLQPDTNVYRITSFKRLSCVFANKALTLVRPSKWDDPFENFLLNAKAKLTIDDQVREVTFDHIRDLYYGQCWTLTEECDGLWRNNRVMGNGDCTVKMRTTVGKLMQAFFDFSHKRCLRSYFIGKVEYCSDQEIASHLLILDPFADPNEFEHSELKSLFMKRRAFSYEQEVRLIFAKPEDVDASTVRNPWDDTDFFSFIIKPSELIDEIEIDPWPTNIEYSDFKEKIVSFGFNEDKIKQSGLYQEPSFTIIL